MKSAIPQTIFLLAGKTVKSLTTQEIAKLIIQSVIYTGIIIGVLLWGVKLYLGFTEVVEWVPKFIDTAIDDFIFWVAMKIGWVLIPIFIPLVASFFDEKTVSLIQKDEYPVDSEGQTISSISGFIRTFRIFIVGLILNLLIIPIIFLDTIRPLLKFIPSFIMDNIFLDVAVIAAPILYIILNSFIFGIEFFHIASAPHSEEHAKEGYGLPVHLSIFAAGAVVLFLTLIPIVNLIVPIIGIILMVHLYHVLIPQTEPTKETSLMDREL